MEITKEEFVEAVNKFKDDYAIHTEINGEHSRFGLVDWDSWVLVCHFNNYFEAAGEIKKYIQNELRQPKAKLIDSWGNNLFELFELGEPIGKFSNVIKAIDKLYGVTDEGLWSELDQEDRQKFWSDYKKVE